MTVLGDDSTIRQAIADKYRKVAVSARGLFKYPIGEASALAMLEGAGFLEARCAGAGIYRTSAFTQATFYTARKPGGGAPMPA